MWIGYKILIKGDIGLISSKSKRLKKVVKETSRRGENLNKNVNKKKAGGVLRHPVLTLKILKQKIRNRRRQRERVTRSLEVGSHSTNSQSSSMASVNNDWTNWVTLHGSEVAKAAYIQNIGKVIGISFKGNNQNKFSILSRPRSVVEEPVLTLVEVAGGVRDGGL